MIGFHLLFPDEAANECRTVIPVGRADLPRRTFVFTEAYCADPQCDCRRVMLNVIDAETHNHVATLNCPVFEPLRDVAVFRQFQVHAEFHTLTWPNGVDLVPEFLHDNVRATA